MIYSDSDLELIRERLEIAEAEDEIEFGDEAREIIGCLLETIAELKTPRLPLSWEAA